MEINLGSVELEYKMLPVQYNADGSVNFTLRRGYKRNGEFVVVGLENYSATKQEADEIMDMPSEKGKTRRDDLSLAIYNFCVTKGAEVGVIS